MTYQIWATDGPGAVKIVSDAAVIITGTGDSATTVRRVFSTVAGKKYRVCWQSDDAIGTFRVGRSAVRWLPPALRDPIIIDLNRVDRDKKVWSFGPDEDVLFLPKSTPWTHDRLQTIGGRNIVLIGGKYTPGYHSSPAATLNFTQNHGSVYIEGVHIDHEGVGEKDGVGYYHEPSSPDGDIIMQNCLIENIKGSYAGTHGDCFQPQGSIKNLRVYNVSTSTQYQSFMLEPRNERGFSIGTITMERVEAVKLTGPETQSWLYYFTESQTPVFPIALKDVYVTEAPGLPAESCFVYPSKGLPAGAIRAGNTIAWPDKPYEGCITVGTPGFVTFRDCGIGYTRDEPVICGEGVSLVEGTNVIDFNAISDKTYLELIRKSAGTVKITGIDLQAA
jgi:hypothetical protein